MKKVPKGWRKCKNFDNCGKLTQIDHWCKECYYEFHESAEELNN